MVLGGRLTNPPTPRGVNCFLFTGHHVVTHSVTFIVLLTLFIGLFLIDEVASCVVFFLAKKYVFLSLNW